MNYKHMLMKYIAHMENLEGATHLVDYNRGDVDFENGSRGTLFTDEEWAEMQKLEDDTQQLTLSEVKEL